MQQLEQENEWLKHEVDTLKGIVDRLAKYAEEWPYGKKQAKRYMRKHYNFCLSLSQLLHVIFRFSLRAE